MHTDRLTILHVIAILLGVPGVVLLFAEGQTAIAVLTLLLVLVVIAAVVIVRMQALRPAYTIEEADIHLRLLGADAARAMMTKRYRLRVNHPQLREILFSNIGSDGTIENIRWNDQPVPATDIRSVRGSYEVTVRFPLPHQKGQTFDGTLSYEAIEAFTDNPEGLWYVPDFPGETVNLLVDLPAERPSKAASLWKVTGAGRKQMDQRAERSPDGTHLRTTLKRTAPGAQYALFWEW